MRSEGYNSYSPSSVKGETVALNIAAFEAISLSELETVMPWINKEWIDENPDTFKQMLYDCGLDVFNFPLDEQLNTHRNRFNNIITTWRWVCMSRTDRDWCESGYASQASKDRATGNRLLVDCYRLRGEVESE